MNPLKRRWRDGVIVQNMRSREYFFLIRRTLYPVVPNGNVWVMELDQDSEREMLNHKYFNFVRSAGRTLIRKVNKNEIH